MRSMFETPWVSTPRRSVIVSTSAPSAASSGLTPSFSKIWVTVRRSAASETNTWSFCGTLKRSRIMVGPLPSRRAERVHGRHQRRRSPEEIGDFDGFLDLGLGGAGGPGPVSDGRHAVRVRLQRVHHHRHQELVLG